MTSEDNSIHDILTKHFSSEAAKAIDPAPSQLYRKILDRLSERSRVRSLIAFALQILFGVGMSITAVAFLKADNLHGELLLSTVLLMLLILAMSLALWRWMMADRSATRREIKRLELAIVLLIEQGERRCRQDDS